jgi:hypothetical protein
MIARGASPDRPAAPAACPGFWGLDLPGKYQAISTIAAQVHLDPETTAFLCDCIPTREDETLRNQIANVLTAHDPILPRLVEALERSALDPGQSALWQDYAIQHLAVCAERIDERAAILDFLAARIRDGQRSVPGTAMLQLGRLIAERRAPAPAGFLATATSAVADGSLPIETRLAAVSVIALLSPPGGVEAMRSAVDAGAPAAVLRAIAPVLGDTGDESDLGRLRRLSESEDPPTARSARAALAKRGGKGD